MSRQILTDDALHHNINEQVNTFHKDTIDEIVQALQTHDVVVVGMAQNPHVKRARKALKQAGQPFEYLEYGSYLGQWRKRLAIKMWSGWPTFPQVYVKGQLIGGANETEAAIASGELKTLIS